MPHVPDTVPGKRVTDAGARTEGRGQPSNILGGSRMQESCPYGSVRGAPSNGCPYRNRELISAGGRNPAASGSTSALDGATRAQLGGAERTVARKWRKTGIFPPFRDAPRVKSVVWRNQVSSKMVYDPYFGTTTSATHIVALEIDPETYKVELDRYVVAEDCKASERPSTKR